MKNPLLAYSNNADALLARGISQTALALNHPHVNELRQRVLDVLQLRKRSPLTQKEREIILDCLTSPAGNNALGTVNHKLFCDFLREQSAREEAFYTRTLTGLEFFERGGQHRHRELKKTAGAMIHFAQEEKNREPKHITPEELWDYVEGRQTQAVNAQNRVLFAEACKSGTTQTLYKCENTKVPTSLRFDPEHELIGGWSKDGRIIDRTVIAGLHPVAPTFYADHITVPCTDAKGELHLLEFDPLGFSTFFGNVPRKYISIISPKNIGKYAILKNIIPFGPDLFYCFVENYGNPKIIHSGPGRTITSNEPIREFRIDSDVIFVAHESTGSCASYKVHSLQTGGYVEIERRNIDKEEETGDDIVFTLRQRDAFNGILHLPSKEPIKWKFGKKWFAKKSVSLRELVQVWHEAAKKAKERKST